MRLPTYHPDWLDRWQVRQHPSTSSEFIYLGTAATTYLGLTEEDYVIAYADPDGLLVLVAQRAETPEGRRVTPPKAEAQRLGRWKARPAAGKGNPTLHLGPAAVAYLGLTLGDHVWAFKDAEGVRVVPEPAAAQQPDPIDDQAWWLA